MNITIKPKCLNGLNTTESQELLTTLFKILSDSKKSIAILERIDYNVEPSQFVDYGELFDLEDFLIEKQVEFGRFGQEDVTGISRYACNGISYFNEVCLLLDVDTCSNTVMECATMLAKLKFTVANVASFMYHILEELVAYVTYLDSVSNPELEEQTKLQYPEFNSECELNISPSVIEVLREFGDPENPITLVDFVKGLVETCKEFNMQKTCILSYFSDYTEFYDLVERTGQVDIQEASAVILPHDIKYVLNMSRLDGASLESILDQLLDKINGRMGVIDEVQSLSYYELDSLVWLAKSCKSQSDFNNLYNMERAVLSDLNKCYLAIARNDLSGMFGVDTQMYQTSLF